MKSLEAGRRIPKEFVQVDGNRSGVVFRPDTVDENVMLAVRRIDRALSGRAVRPIPTGIIARVMPGEPGNIPPRLGKPERQTVFYMGGNALCRIPRTREDFRLHAGYLSEEIDRSPLAFYIAPDTGKPIATWDAVLETAINTKLIRLDMDLNTGRAVRNGTYDTIMSHGLTERDVRHLLHIGMGVNPIYIGNGEIFNFDTGRTVALEMIGPNVSTFNPRGAILFVGE